MTITAHDVAVRPASDLTAPRRRLPKSFGPRTLKIIMPWLSNFWITNKRFPFPDEFIKQFMAHDGSQLTVEWVEQLLINPLFKRSCEARGIDRNFWERGFSVRQTSTIALLANIGDGRSRAEKLAQLGVTEGELEGWERIPSFRDTLAARIKENLGNFDTEAYSSLGRNILRGNQRAIEYYLRLTGKDENQELVDLRRVLKVIQNSIERHIKDPTVLQAIAEDLRPFIEA